MGGDIVTFLFALIIDAILLFAMVFFMIMFSDLESDYINPIDLCNRLNLVSIHIVKGGIRRR
jgi:hypothetical protein